MKWAFIFLLSTPLFAAPLTLEKCREIALDQNPAIRASKEGVRIASEDIGKARAPYWFQTDVIASAARWQTYAFIPTQLQQYPQFMFTRYGPFNDLRLAVQARYVLFDSGQRQAELKSALLKRGIACHEAEKIRQEIAMNVSAAFFSLAGNLELLEVNKRRLQRAKSHQEVARRRKEVGSVPQIDLYRAKVGVADARQELARVKGVVRISTGNLNTSMGLSPNCAVEIAPDEFKVEQPHEDLGEKALVTGLEARPEMRRAHLELEALCQEIKRAEAEFGPKVVAEGSYGVRGEHYFPSTREFYAGVGLRWNLFDGRYSTHNLRQAKEKWLYQKERKDQLALAVQQEIWRSWSELIESWEMVETTFAEVEDAKESHRHALERYEMGSSTMNDLLDAETALSRAEAVWVEARWNFRLAETSFSWSQGLLN